ncbi:helix-turn-helix protein [Salegentibacter sp. 24]|uniref:AraC family transcriptional regulator n=1 Tax=Salegentibacter sp. 24 TaxID=2183986 RepID=UPI00105BEEA3|nr:helix-turn-helix domain-containing protein [Salegentibacter sp. 24]TDN79354.1 helix-turn-helix protein [Salegentibacter sp. 24]
MEREFNKANLRGIYRMLTEWAKGNFSYRIKRTRYRDELEGLVAYFNHTGEELNNKRDQFLRLNRQNEIVNLRSAVFILNKNLEVLDYSYKHPDNEEVESSKIIGKAFQELLVGKFQGQWQEKISLFLENGSQSFNLNLEYQFDEYLKISLPSVVSRLKGTGAGRFTVTSYQLDTPNDLFVELPKNSGIKTYSKWDQKLFHEIHIYIMHHLEEPLKPLDQLAELFNTNEHKIKTGFKEIFGCTPFQYHAKERIKQCKILIESTNLNLTEISDKMGFGSYPHFSKSFKEKIKVSPKHYQKFTRNA